MKKALHTKIALSITALGLSLGAVMLPPILYRHPLPTKAVF